MKKLTHLPLHQFIATTVKVGQRQPDFIPYEMIAAAALLALTAIATL